mgnify:CR=1 FL=1
MAKGSLAPLGMRCALASAITTTTGTATACPSPSEWQRDEQAAYMIQDPPGGWQAIFHDRGAASAVSISLDCWSRAASVGAVS